MKSRYSKISIVILNWQHWAETLECLQSVLLNDYPNFDCIVVDNGSNDNSEQKIIQWLNQQENIVTLYLPSNTGQDCNLGPNDRGCYGVYEYCNETNSRSSVQITLLQTGSNLGYSGGNNIGIERALENGCAYVLIMNNDTVVKQDFVSEIVKAALDSDASIIGGIIKDASGKKILASGESLLKACLSFGLKQPKAHKCAWWQTDCVNGSAMMLSRELLIQRKSQLGYYLIPDLFLYCEEIEIGFWCKTQGLKSIIAGNAEIFHEVGTSSDWTNTPFPFYYLTRNRLNVARQYLKGAKLCLYYFSFIPLRFMRASYYFLSGKKDIAHAILLGLLDGLKNVTGPKNTL